MTEPAPSLAANIGVVVATVTEANMILALSDLIEDLFLSHGAEYERPETYLDDPLWHQVTRRALDVLTLLITNGGGWDVNYDFVVDEEHLVPDYPGRGLAAQCLASLAYRGGDDGPQPPLRRDFDDAVRILRDRCSLTDPNAAIDRIYRDGPEISRLDRLSSAVEKQETQDTIADLAGRALTAIVHEGAGCNYDQPIDR